MLPGNGIGDTDKTCYPGSPEYKFKYGSEGLNTTDIKEYIRNPHKFNTQYEMDGKYYNLWSTDNDKTDANDEVVIKSVYDPSPVGYSLPASNAFTGFTTTGEESRNSSELNVKGNFDKGWYFYTKPNKQGILFRFPACGHRHYVFGSLIYVATDGCCWVAGPYDTNFVRCLGFVSSIVYPLYGSYRSWGFPVRSAEEKETYKFNTKWDMDGKYYNLWSTDNDKTVPNDDVVIKSVYDPSPVGYSLPASNAFTGFTDTGLNTGNPGNPAIFNVKGSFDKGWYYYTKLNRKGNTIFLLTTGLRSDSYGLVKANSGVYWTIGISNLKYGRYLNFSENYIGPLHDLSKAYGFAVRSAEEKEEIVTIFQHLRFVFYYIQKRTSYLSYLLYINYFVFYPVLSYYDGISISLCNVPFYTDYLEMACMGS